jgi:thiol-disulfide isomerase/thioredoxin
MLHELRICAAVVLCAVSCKGALAADATPPNAKPNQTTLVVRLVDKDGKPIEGARVGVFAQFADFERESKYFLPDETGWRYYPQIVSDHDGMARITDDDDIDFVVARHVGKKLVGIQTISPGQSQGSVTVTMQPQCKVSGRLTSKELEARHRKFPWSNVYLYLNDEQLRPMMCQSHKGEFHFYVPPGTYNLNAYSNETHGAWKTITVKPGQETLDVDPIDLPPRRLTLLQGEPAPELQDVVAWKNGGPIKLSDLRGKVVLLEFWGHWCGPCVGGMPDVFALHDKYHDKGLVVIGIHVDMANGVDTAAKLDAKLVDIKKRLWKDRDLPFPVALVLMTEKGKCPPLAEDIYDIPGFPTGVLIDRRGRVVGQFVAGYKPDEAILEKAISEN